MAKFDVTNGYDELQMDLQKLGQLSKEDHWEILTPAATVVVEKLQFALNRLLTQHTGKLVASIKAFRKSGGGSPYMLVYPYGNHHKYAGVEKTKEYKRSKHGRTYTYGGGDKTATANDLAFVFEYGAPSRNIPAHHWMENTLLEFQYDIADALDQGFNDYCDKRGIGQ